MLFTAILGNYLYAEHLFYIQRKHYKHSFHGDMHIDSMFLLLKCAKYSGIIIKFTNI